MTCTQRSGNKYQIGTSGFMVSQKKWSELPCLNCIEINGSFYRIPTDKMIQNLLNLPKNINFIIKASRYITHTKRLKDVKEAWDKLFSQINKLGLRLKCILIQLPPSFINNDTNIERLKIMEKYLPKKYQYAVEFRNISWFEESTYKLFKTFKWAIVGTFIIKNKNNWLGTMENGITLPPLTSNFNYMRIHGKAKYKGSLSDSQLIDIKNKMQNQNSKISYIMFNNTFFDNRGQYCKYNNTS